MRPIAMVPIGFALLALLFALLSLHAWRRRRAVSGAARMLAALLFLVCASLGGLVAIGTVGYHALTRETVAATATVAERDDGSHVVSLVTPDGDERTFVIRGDELEVEAQILKWHPAANVMGLHTGYALERIEGRYREVGDEQMQPRTVYELSADPPVDLFAIVRRYPFLSGLVDATYGSGTFTPLREGAVYEIRVSTTGLLVRTAE